MLVAEFLLFTCFIFTDITRVCVCVHAPLPVSSSGHVYSFQIQTDARKTKI